MKKIDWSNVYLTGDAVIDQQHQQLVETINACIDAIAAKEDRSAFIPKLLAITHQHLAHEEAFLTEIGYPNLAAHFEEHQTYREEINRELSASQKITAKQIDSMSHWWSNHILQSDMKYKIFLKKR